MNIPKIGDKFTVSWRADPQYQIKDICFNIPSETLTAHIIYTWLYDPTSIYTMNYMEFMMHIENGYYVYAGECQHEYKQYQGFTQSYNYCTKCDKKKE